MRPLRFTSVAALVAFHAAGAAELSTIESQAARKLYNTKCARCHKFYDPANYDDASWQTWMTKMSKKAKLKPAETAILSRYLGSYRTQPASNVTSTVTPR